MVIRTLCFESDHSSQSSHLLVKRTDYYTMRNNSNYAMRLSISHLSVSNLRVNVACSISSNRT